VGRGKINAILALGGGVIGDLAGFERRLTCAACRWCKSDNLLAQCDSRSAGTAVDYKQLKNEMGLLSAKMTYPMSQR